MHAVHRAGRDARDVVAGDPHRERVGVEPGAAAVAAGLGELILPEEDPDVLLVPLLLQILQEREDPDVASLAAVEQLPPVGGLELVPRRLSDRRRAPGVLEQHLPARLVAGLGPRVDGAVGQAALGIGHDERLVVLQHGAEAVAGGAGAARVVEGEEGGGDGRGRGVAGAAGRRTR